MSEEPSITANPQPNLSPQETVHYDIFMSHASEDKARFVEPLVKALEARGKRVWYDKKEILCGDDFRVKMEEGLSTSNYGVVILSHNFFKYWPQSELSALFTLEKFSNRKKILPVLLGMSLESLVLRSPFLATRNSLNASEGVSSVANHLCFAIDGRAPDKPAREGRSLLFGTWRPPSSNFVGREKDLETLAAQLLETGKDVSISASIAGLAGVGKTELAIQLVHHLAQKGAFPGGIYWLDAATPDLIAQWGSKIADDKEIGEGPLEDRARAVLNDASRKGPSVLVVLDNVHDWAEDCRPGPLPQGSHVQFLATTRVQELGSPFVSHPLDILQEEDASALLEKVSGRKSTADATALLAYLDGHALALELAGQYLRHFKRTTFSEYLMKLKAGDAARGHTKVEKKLAYQATVDNALHVAWDTLEAELQDAWRLAACFEDGPATADLAAVCSLDEERLADLESWSLVRTNEDGRWTMHRLVRDYGRQRPPEDERTAALAKYYSGCMTRAQGIDELLGHHIYLPDQMHYDAVAQVAQRSPERLGEEYSGQFLMNLGRAQYSAGFSDQAIEFYQNALSITRKALGDEHPSVAQTYNNLANAWEKKGEYDQAIELAQKALDIELKALGPEHPEVASTYNNLAVAWGWKGELDTAIQLYQKALDIRLKTLGPEHPLVATIYNNLGKIWSDKDEYDKVIELYQKALDLWMKSLGPKHPYIATTYNNLAYAWTSKGEYGRAIDFLEKALNLYDKSLGGDHPYVANTYSNLGKVWSDKGEYDRAIEFYQKTLDIQLKSFGDDHPDVANIYSNLGNAWFNKGEYDKAIGLYQKTLDIQLKSLGDDHPDVADTYNNLGYYLWSFKKEYDQAIELYEKALEIYLEAPENTQTEIALIYNNIGAVWESRKAYDKAILYHNKALEIRRQSLGLEAPDVAWSHNHLGTNYMHKGEYDSALKHYTEAVRIAVAKLGEDHTRTKLYIENLNKLKKLQNN